MKGLELKIAHRFLSGFSLEVDVALDGGVTALFGPSGSGKSTLLSILAGITKPDNGEIAFKERVLLNTEKRIFVPPHKRHFGFVFQDHLLFPHLTVEKNLRYGLNRQARLERGITYEKVVQILELGFLLNQYPKTLSGGQQQRVALGRALLSGPELLLMDEPLTALDESLKGRVLEYLERVFMEWRIPTIYVSHNVNEVLRLAEQVVRLEDGKVRDQGATDEVLAHLGSEMWRFRNGSTDPELKEISEKWTLLPLEIRKKVLTDVRRAEFATRSAGINKAVAS